MNALLKNLILSVVVACAVTLGCILLGVILESLKVQIAVVIGGFLAGYSAILGVLAGLWWFFTHQA